MIKKIILWILVIFISVQIFSFSSDNSNESSGKSGKFVDYVVEIIKDLSIFEEVNETELREQCQFIIRKGAHFSIYMLLALAVFELSKSYNLKVRHCILISALYCLFYAISDEIHQLFVDGRSGEVRDVFVDFSGASFGLTFRMFICKFVKLSRNKRKKEKF